MKFENIAVMNFENAFRGMRNPLNSWNKSDSYFGMININDDHFSVENCDVLEAWGRKKKYDLFPREEYCKRIMEQYEWLLKNGTLKIDGNIADVAFIGPADMDLAQRLILSGPEHAKFLRQIFFSVDITAPLYWWKEADTYKIGTTANSTSTMHKLAFTPITLDCFEMDDMQDVIIEDSSEPTFIVTSNYMANTMITWLEELRQKYNETKDKRYWKELIRWLPESWLQTRTWTANYAVLRNIYFQRKNHKLTEWHSFCNWIEKLPYAKELITIEIDKNK